MDRLGGTSELTVSSQNVKKYIKLTSHFKEDDTQTRTPEHNFCGKSVCDVNHIWSRILNSGRVL